MCLVHQFEIHKLNCEREYGWYSIMLEKYPERSELMIGLANLYYVDYYYLKAQELYHGALHASECKEKLYEYLGWVEGYMFERD